jgi:hypothetical protein
VTSGIAVSDNDAVLAIAAEAIRNFSEVWLPRLEPGGAAAIKQDEHALESRVLRGHAPVSVPGVGQPSLVREDPVVNWGSQFPTKWGRGGSARYLDALLRDGHMPWAVEIKIHGAGGAGGYYRHAVAQAVLYRHFIAHSTPLKEWFDKFDLDQRHCQAAVLVPEMTGPLLPWRTRLRRVADLFAVKVLEIDSAFAGLHH